MFYELQVKSHVRVPPNNIGKNYEEAIKERLNTDFEGYQGVVSVENAPGLPDKYQLSQNYPNPFNPSTKIKYDISSPTRVQIQVSDMIGRLIENVLDETGNMQDNTLTDRLTILFEDIQWYITQLNK